VQPEPALPVVSAPAATPAVSPEYGKAEAAYAGGDYRRAAELFDALGKDASDPVLARRAAYGLACSLLMSAETREEYKGALGKWNQWAAMAPVDGTREDPRMLGPLLQILRQPGDGREAPRPSKADADCAKRLADKDKEVRLLNNQIKALEKIHREIQERKKEISSP